MKLKKFIIAYTLMAVTALTALLATSTYAIYVKDAKSGGSYGEVSLRSYYDSGEGTLAKPFIITKPRHLYNLSRLQGLGIYDDPLNPTYFQLGKPMGGYDFACYASDSSSEVVPYLDMTDYAYDIYSIGSESTPFYGFFDGKYLEIRGLVVNADPEDAGLFGYTAHGSKVENLFLDDITIRTKGYKKPDYNIFYGDTRLSFSPQFTYGSGADAMTYTSESNTKTYKDELSFTATWGENPSISGSGPTVSWSASHSDSDYHYELLRSGSFLTNEDSNGTFTINTADVLSFFNSKKSVAGITYPIQASTSMSIIATTPDDKGHEHSRVLLTLSFDFTLLSATTNLITCDIHTGRAHGNNIGLIIGHCDGTVNHCYVHNGHFDMNVTDTNYQAMANNSEMGLIGVIGNTVHNISAESAGISAQEGTTVGVLDFSKLHKTVLGQNNTTFSKDTSKTYTTATGGNANPWTYTPDEDISDYYKSLLRRAYGTYYTAENNSVTFKGQEVIRGTDLGVFSIATDHAYDGIDGNVLQGMANTVIRQEDPRQYIYYSTGEFRKFYDDKNNTGELTFSDYRNAFASDNPSYLIPGYHLPKYGETTWQSFSKRELLQNYFFRFKLDASRTGFYFSDLDTTKIGSSFLTKYFEYKLVDDKDNHVFVDATGKHIKSANCGISILDSGREHITEFYASFATRDYSAGTAADKLWVITQDENYPVANMVNFKITTDWANVTVIAAPTDSNKSAAVGLYRFDPTVDGNYAVQDGYRYLKRNYNDPDYAFFMPSQGHLAYFDYKVCAVDMASGVEMTADLTHPSAGRIGTYFNDNGTWRFKEADYRTSATVPSANGTSEYNPDYGTPRLYAHTFRLPKGNYCIGSATGSSNGSGFTSSKIYYVCAQGQDEGETDFVDNAFGGNDTVDNVDFVKSQRADIKIPGVDFDPAEIDAATLASYHDYLLTYQRCYLMLNPDDVSSFDAADCNVDFLYDDTSGGKFVIRAGANNTDLSSVIKTVVRNYGATYGTEEAHIVSDLTNIYFKLYDYDLTNVNDKKWEASS